jgi:oligosaccharyltransferase complex subunit delta (ribophorin II)
VSFGPSDTLKLLLTTVSGSKASRPHQALLTLRNPSGLEAAYPILTKDTGKAKLELSYKDLPVQFQISPDVLTATLVLGSFGETQAFEKQVFAVQLVQDPTVPVPRYEAPERYAKKEEIHHVFRDDQKSPPKVISLFFVAAILATVPVLLGTWVLLKGNLEGLGSALKAAPGAHVVFFGSLVAMEGVYAMYYLSWNLFKVLPVAGAVSVVAFVSGSKALSEVQARRLAGER